MYITLADILVSHSLSFLCLFSVRIDCACVNVLYGASNDDVWISWIGWPWLWTDATMSAITGPGYFNYHLSLQHSSVYIFEWYDPCITKYRLDYNRHYCCSNVITWALIIVLHFLITINNQGFTWAHEYMVHYGQWQCHMLFCDCLWNVGPDIFERMCDNILINHIFYKYLRDIHS